MAATAAAQTRTINRRIEDERRALMSGAAAHAFGSILRSQLAGLSARDPIVYGSVLFVLAAAGCAAMLAQRAGRCVSIRPSRCGTSRPGVTRRPGVERR